jgi:hypothetical protein
MAKTYYGYVERNAGDFVNWAAIGENVVQVLQEEGNRRIAIKNEIDKADREWGNVLVNPPQGVATKFNEWALNQANQGSAYRLMTTRLLKSGKMSLSDYLVSRQNAVDGYAGLFDLMKEYNAEAESRINDYNNGKSAALDMNVMEDIESFANYSRTGVYISPVNGELSIAFKDETTDQNGNKIYTMSKDPNKFATINSLQNRLKTRYNKFDVVGSMDQLKSSMGTHLEVMEKVKATTQKQGQLWSYTDPMLRKNLPKDAQGVMMKFEEAETILLNSYLTNNFNTASILTDYKGVADNNKTYDFTWDRNEFTSNENLILKKLDDNGNLILEVSDKQKDQAREYLRVQARIRYEHQESVTTSGTTPFAPQRISAPVDNEDQQALIIAKEIAGLVTGDQARADQAAFYFGNQGRVIDKEGGKISINGVPSSMAGTPFDYATSLISVLNLGVNQTKVMNHLKKYLGGSLNTSINTKSPAAAAPKPDYDKAQFQNYINQKASYNDNSIVEDDPATTVANLTGLFGNLGYTFEGSGTIDDVITITANGRKSPQFFIDDPNQSIEAIRNWMINNPVVPNLKTAFAPK